MKSLVTKRTVSVGPTGVSAPPAPTFQTPSITGVFAGAGPVQWYSIFRPDTCGKRPVLIVGLQTALNPFAATG